MYSGALLFCCEDFLTLKSRCNSDWSFDAYIAETSRNHGTSVGRTNLAHVCHFKSNLHFCSSIYFLPSLFHLIQVGVAACYTIDLVLAEQVLVLFFGVV